MRDDLLHYYERELTFLRRSGAEFARKYPKVAGRLQLEPTKCEDPHVERLLEGFAFMAARVHLKLDEDFSEISEALLGVAYPQYVRPLPSMTMVQFHLDPEQGKLTTGLHVPRESILYSRPVAGHPLKFRTCYETTVWPITVSEAQWCAPHELSPPVRARDAVAALRIRLSCAPDVTFAELELDRLRLHISAESGLASTLYELLLSRVAEVRVRRPDDGTLLATLPGTAIEPVGFGADEGLIPYPQRAFLPYRLLQEYFAFPEKYMFLDVTRLGAARKAEAGEEIDLIFLVRRFERADREDALVEGVSEETFRLGCTPAVNLFPLTSEPVILSHKRHEYPVVADARRRESTRIYSVNEVVAVTPGAAESEVFQPLYSIRHGRSEKGRYVYWYARRRANPWRTEDASDVVISFVDEEARYVRPDLDAVSGRLTCFNGALPSRLQFGAPEGDFEMPGGGPIERIVALVKPTPPVEPPLGKPQLWRLISQLALNYVSLVENDGEALREVLRLHNMADSRGAEKQIQGIVGVSSRPSYAGIESEHGVTFARGNRVDVTFDEERFAGAGVYLFATVLEHFLGLCSSLNSFCALTALTNQRKEALREWPPRAGRKVLL